MRIVFISFLLLPLCIVAQRIPHAQLVMQDNELKRSVDYSSSHVHYNPLLLNGKPLDYVAFTMFSRGSLQLIRETPESVKAIPILFHAYLRREREVIAKTDRPSYELDLNLLLPKAKPGDQLIIDPANDEDWKAKRILKLIL